MWQARAQNSPVITTVGQKMPVDSAFLWQFKALQPGNGAQRIQFEGRRTLGEDDVQTAQADSPWQMMRPLRARWQNS